MNKKGLIGLLILIFSIGFQSTQGTINETVDDETDLELKTLTTTVEGIQINLTYYQKLAITGFPVSFTLISKNVTDDTIMIHVDPVVKIKSGSEIISSFFGHTHTGDFTFEYTFETSGSYSFDISLSTTGDTVIWLGSDYDFGLRTTLFTLAISDHDLPSSIIGGGLLELQGINVEFIPSSSNPSVGELTTFYYNITFSNGSLLRHITTQLIVLDPDGNLVFSSRQFHAHTAQIQGQAKLTKNGLYRTLLYISPTAPPLRTQFDTGNQVATFGLNVGSSNTPGFELPIVFFSIFILLIVGIKKRN